MFITGILIILQLSWIGVLAFRLIKYAAWINIAFSIISFIIILRVIAKAGVPAYRMGWILVIMFLPVLGGPLYLLIGEKRPSKHMREKIENAIERRGDILKQEDAVLEKLEKENPRVAGTAKYINDFAKFPICENTSLKYHALGEEQFADILVELKKAKKFIFLEYFIIEKGLMWDSMLEILKEKAKEGVDVRLMYDDLGCLTKLNRKYCREIESMGIKCHVFNPLVPALALVMNNRDHRKMLIIDGNVAFTGGINLADEYINHVERFGHWKDTGALIRGKGVFNYTVMFLDMWNAFRPTEENYESFMPDETEKYESDGYIQAFSDSPLDLETVSVNVYSDILAQSKNYVYILTPYLAISDELQLQLIAASKRGVDVRIVVPGIPDKKIAYRLTRSYYPPLIEAGVKIYEYTPGFIHAKSYVCDDEIGVIGTINMDYRSLYLHFECGAFLYKSSLLDEIKKDCLETFEKSHIVKLSERRLKNPIFGIIGALFDAILRVFAPLF